MNNPLYLRYRASQKRANTLGIYGLVYGVTLFLTALWSTPTRNNSPYPPLLEFCTSAYGTLWLLEVLLLIWAAVQTGRVIPKEIEQKSFDFFRLLPLSPRTKFLGLALGVNTPLFILVGTTVLLENVVVLGSRHSLALHFELQLLTLLAGLFLQVVAFLLSTSTPGQRLNDAGILRLLVVIPLGLASLPFLIGGTAAFSSMSSQHEFDEVTIPYFSAKVPIFLPFSVLLIHLIAWGYAGCLRRLRVEDEPLFPRRGAHGFFALGALLVFGLFMEGERLGERYGFFTVMVLVLAVFTFVGARTPVSAYLAARQKLKQPLRHLWFRISNLRLGAELTASATLALALGAHFIRYPWTDVLYILVTLVLTLSFLCLLSEVLAVSVERRAHARLIIGFVAVLYVIFPLVLAAWGLKSAPALSGIDFVFYLIGSPKNAANFLLELLISHAIYLLVLAAIIQSSYSRLSALTETLDGNVP